MCPCPSPLSITSRSTCASASNSSSRYSPTTEFLLHDDDMMECNMGLYECLYNPTSFDNEFFFPSELSRPVESNAPLPMSPATILSFAGLGPADLPLPNSLSTSIALSLDDELDLEPIFTNPFASGNASNSASSSSSPSSSSSSVLIPLEKEEEKTVCPFELCLKTDKRHDRAEDALKARLTVQPRFDAPTFNYTTVSPQMISPIYNPVEKSRKRPYEEKTKRHEAEIVPSISCFARASRPIAPLPRKAKPAAPAAQSIMKPNNFMYPQQMFHAPSPISSAASSSFGDSDYEHDTREDDGDFTPGGRGGGGGASSSASRSKKRQRRTAGPSTDRNKAGRKTQLQVVLEDLPFTMADILYSNGFYHCPFSDCSQTTTSEGDLGRHLESSTHATHRYVCLSARCLDDFAREDSMKRHHANNRGKHHKAEHERAVKQGFSFRVRIRDVASVKARVAAAARAEGRT